MSWLRHVQSFRGRRARRDEINSRHEALASQQQAIEREVAGLTTQLGSAHNEMETIRQTVSALESWLNDDASQLEQLEDSCKQRQKVWQEARKVQQESDQRLEELETRASQLQRDQDERDRALDDSRSKADLALERQAKSELAVLAVTSEISELYLSDSDAADALRLIALKRDDLQHQRSVQNRRLNESRELTRRIEQRQHTQQMEAERIRRDRDSMAERLLEDYGIAVDQLGGAEELSLEEQEERVAVDQEIAELRRKISNLGSVNMTALDELNELDTRYESLSSQYQDLVDAKESLEKIIQKINTDSRRLFAETLEAIRANFQVMFRKVFGGGSADIILEEGEDILESGIDVIATPPGKQSLGLSLLSGGERALTAVTLLMAIFEYRPSPFCVLDEVDGPLDEANIGRFVDVLREFLVWTKFVVVTHSKKTMTAAHTLYGVTMQESGVSKRVSVKFEDVSDDGHISAQAIERSEDVA